MKRQNGLALIELLIVFPIFFILFVWFFLTKTILQGNCWFTENGVLRELRIENSQASEILKTTRNVYTDSIIYVKVGDKTMRYCLDSSILFNYEFSHCPDN